MGDSGEEEREIVRGRVAEERGREWGIVGKKGERVGDSGEERGEGGDSGEERGESGG